MGQLAILVYSILFLLLLRWGRVGPVLLVASYTFVSLIVFFLNDTELVYFEPYHGLPLPMRGGYFYSTNIYLVSIAIALMCVFTTLYLRRINNGFTLHFYIDALLKVKNKPRFVFINYVLLAIFFLLYIWHILEVDFDPIMSNTAYLFNVDPLNVGAKSSVAVIMHNLSGPIGLMFSFMMVFYFRAKRYDMFALMVLLFSYCLFIKSSQFSRWLPLMFAGIAISIFMVYRSRKKYIPIVIFVVLTLFSFILVFKGRGSFEQGFLGFVVQILYFTLEDLSYLTNFIVNVFGGFIIYAEALEMNWSYDLGYIVRSFSPLPGFIDGWQVYVVDVGKINKYVPFSVFGEIYFFGEWIGYFVSFLFFLTLIRIEYVYRKYPSIFSVLGLIIFIYIYLASFFYPVRNVFRIYLICLFFYEMSSYYVRKSRLRNINS